MCTVVSIHHVYVGSLHLLLRKITGKGGGEQCTGRGGCERNKGRERKGEGGVWFGVHAGKTGAFVWVAEHGDGPRLRVSHWCSSSLIRCNVQVMLSREVEWYLRKTL